MPEQLIRVRRCKLWQDTLVGVVYMKKTVEKFALT